MSRFILSCTTSTTSIPGRDNISECFIHAPKAGYKAWGAQSPLFWWPGMTRWVNIDLIIQCAREVGLERCTEVGSPLVVITGRPRRDGGLEPTIAGIKALLQLIENKPVRLALEPHFGSQIQFFEDYDAIFEQIESSQIGITLDSGHFHSAGVDWRRLIHCYPERIYNFHVKDHIGAQSVPLGAGEIDLRGYIEELHAIGYEGALAVELEVVDPENLPRYCAEAFVYLRDLVKNVTGKFPD